MWWPHDSYYRIRKTLFREKLLTASLCDGGKKGNEKSKLTLTVWSDDKNGGNRNRTGKGEGGRRRERYSVGEDKHTQKKQPGLWAWGEGGGAAVK